MAGTVRPLKAELAAARNREGAYWRSTAIPAAAVLVACRAYITALAVSKALATGAAAATTTEVHTAHAACIDGATVGIFRITIQHGFQLWVEAHARATHTARAGAFASLTTA